jgi:ankyrin repeat protein
LGATAARISRARVPPILNLKSSILNTRISITLLLLFLGTAPAFPQQPAQTVTSDLRLIAAARSQDRGRVAALLQQGVNVDQRQPDGATALHWAVHWEDAELVTLLLGAKANVNLANDLGVTPLVMAATNGNGPLIEQLLAAGADPNASLESGETALMLASRAGSVAGVKALLARGAKIDTREGTRGQTALMWAIVSRHPEVTRVLLEHGADITLRSATRTLVFNMGGSRSAGSAAADTPLEEVPLGGSTPMLFAARSGDVASARMLIAQGANVNDTTADGNTALIIAVHSGHGTLAALLLEHGADVKAAPLGYTALHAAVLRGTLRDRGVKNDDPGAGLPLVKALLARGADPNARVQKGTPLRRWSHDFALLERWVGATPLWLAARFLEIDMLRVLAEAGADVHLAAKDGTTPVMAAAGTGYSRASGTEAFIKDRRDFSSYNSEPFAVATRIPAEEERLVVQALQVLVQLGGDVNRTNAAGDTAVHAAAALGMNSVIAFLAERGANLNVRNKAGRSPIDVARRDDGIGTTVVREDTVAVLRQHGAQ